MHSCTSKNTTTTLQIFIGTVTDHRKDHISILKIVDGILSDLQIVTSLLAVGDPLELSRGGEVQGLAQIGEAEGSGYPHVCQRQVVHIQQGP